MGKNSVRNALRVAWVMLALALAGCGTTSYTGGGLDPDRLLNAIVADDVGYVRSVISAGVASPNQQIPAPVYMEGTPLLTIAARAASLNVIRYLLSAGADVNARTPAGETPLMLAAYFKDETVTFSSPTERHEAAVRLLVAAGATLENDGYSFTPLAYASYQNRERTVRYLLERGARVNADAENGMVYANTPLMMAVIMGHRDLAVTLLRAGADPRIRMKDGLTARELAVKYRHGSLAELLSCAETLRPGDSFAGRCLGL